MIHDKIREILFIIIIPLTIDCCSKYEILHIPISNYSNSDFHMTINFLGENKSILIRKNSFSQEYLGFKYINKEKKYFDVTIVEKKTKNIVSKQKLGFPGEGVISDSAKGGLFFVIDIFQTEYSYNVIYSYDVFKYGFPNE
jgi:hypothetical protein